MLSMRSNKTLIARTSDHINVILHVLSGKGKFNRFMKVLFLTNIPSPYRVQFFNELGKKCDLTVLFERKGYDTRDKSWRDYRFETFQGIVLKGIEVGRFEKISAGICRYIKKGAYDHIIVASAASITGLLALAWMRLRNIPYYIEGDGGYAGSGRGIKERIKGWYISKAKLCFSTSEVHDQYYLKYGGRREALRRYPFTSLRQEDILKRPLSRDEKEAIKESLGICERYYILSVGSFIYRKGMDVLIRACECVPEDWGIYIIGGMPTQEYLDLKSRMGLQCVHFIDFQLPDTLKEYYCAADLFVLATREDIWGLVINEAMACGLPVITTEGCVSGRELVENGINGYIVPVGNVESLQGRMMDIIEDEDLREKMADASLKKIVGYTFERMADVHMRVMEAEGIACNETDRG